MRATAVHWPVDSQTVSTNDDVGGAKQLSQSSNRSIPGYVSLLRPQMEPDQDNWFCAGDLHSMFYRHADAFVFTPPVAIELKDGTIGVCHDYKHYLHLRLRESLRSCLKWQQSADEGPKWRELRNIGAIDEQGRHALKGAFIITEENRDFVADYSLVAKE